MVNSAFYRICICCNLRVVRQDLGADVSPSNARQATDKEAGGEGAPAVGGLQRVALDLTASEGLQADLGTVTLQSQHKRRGHEKIANMVTCRKREGETN